MSAPRKVRLNADLSPDVAEALKNLAEKQGVSLTEALSRAISTEAVLAEKRRKGGKVLIQEGEGGSLKELLFTRA
jgi:putative aminopeptidase FrvX